MIRAYVDADLDAVLDIWYRASQIAHSFLSEGFFERERREIARRWMPIADAMVAEIDGRVVGFVALIGNEVGAVFVDPDQQGRGVGRSLIDAGRATRPYLELTVFEENAIGRRFYDAYGFRIVGRQMNETAGHHELRLRLDGAS